MRYKALFIITLSHLIPPVKAGVSQLVNSDTRINVHSWIVGSSPTTPVGLWRLSGGTIEMQGFNYLDRVRATRSYSTSSLTTIVAGVDWIVRASQNYALNFNELFLAARHRSFELSAGWREHTAGLVDSTLSSGSFIFSRNAATIPRVSVGTPEFTDVPGFFGLVAFKAFWSHGWMGTKRYVKNAYLHEKSFHLRFFGKEDFPVLGFAGITHAVIWGGDHPEFGKIPRGLSDYMNVILGKPGEDKNLETNPKGTLGNSVAAIDFALQLNLTNMRTLLYRQFYLEAQSDIRFRNSLDGIWGLSITRKGMRHVIHHVLWEFIYTKRQGDRVAGGPRTDFSSYYSNFVYRTGWTHRGRTLGNPLLFSDGSLIDPVKNKILVAHHLGVEGAVSESVWYRALMTYSRNYGSRDDCTDSGCTGNPQLYTGRLDQYSFLLEAKGPLPLHRSLSFSVAVAFDTGELYEDSFGGMVGVSWSSQ